MTFEGTPRPAPRWTHATTELDDFMMITYRVDPRRLDDVTPSEFRPTVFPFDDGSEGGLVSAVPFLDRDFHFNRFPVVKVACGQVNYRAYGTLRGERGVWFFGTSLDSIFVALPRYGWRMPWHRDRVRIDADWAPADGRARVRLSAVGSWGNAACDVVTTGAPFDRIDGFRDGDETKEVLTHPTTGWFRRTDGRLGKYTVWHPVFDPRPCDVRYARFEVFEDLGLVDPDTRPHSALVQPTIHFDVHTPPHRLDRSG